MGSHGGRLAYLDLIEPEVYYETVGLLRVNGYSIVDHLVLLGAIQLEDAYRKFEFLQYHFAEDRIGDSNLYILDDIERLPEILSWFKGDWVHPMIPYSRNYSTQDEWSKAFHEWTKSAEQEMIRAEQAFEQIKDDFKDHTKEEVDDLIGEIINFTVEQRNQFYDALTEVQFTDDDTLNLVLVRNIIDRLNTEANDALENPVVNEFEDNEETNEDDDSRTKSDDEDLDDVVEETSDVSSTKINDKSDIDLETDKPDNPETPNDSNVSSKDDHSFFDESTRINWRYDLPQGRFYMRRNVEDFGEVKGRVDIDGDEIFLLKGSVCAPINPEKKSSVPGATRSKMGHLISHENILMRDVKCLSLGDAANFVSGMLGRNGDTEWRTDKNVKIKALRKSYEYQKK